MYAMLCSNHFCDKLFLQIVFGKIKEGLGSMRDRLAFIKRTADEGKLSELLHI